MAMPYFLNRDIKYTPVDYSVLMCFYILFGLLNML